MKKRRRARAPSDLLNPINYNQFGLMGVDLLMFRYLPQMVVLLLTLAASLGSAQTGSTGSAYSAELDLQQLRSLSRRSVSKASEDISDPKKIVLRCAQETEKRNAYISELTIRDRTQKQLVSSDFVSVVWRIDFRKPDRYHVIQKSWNGRPDYLYDEWVTLGSEHYDNVGVGWLESPQGSRRVELNPSFRADKWVSILRTEKPKSAGIYSYAGRRYYLLGYESSTLGDFAKFSMSLKDQAHISIWIDADTGLLAKGDLAGNTEPEVPFELEQVFAGYGSDVQIKAPQVGANANLGSVQTGLPELKTVQDCGNFMQAYYLHPQPQFIGNLIEALQSTGYLQKRNNAPGAVGFFSEVFTANSDQVAQWQALIAKQDNQTKAVLYSALSVSAQGGVTTFDSQHSGQMNDEYWGAFFATGNPKFIQKLVDQLRYFDDRIDFQLFTAGGTAMWSLSSLSRSQPAVRRAIEDAKPKVDKRTQELISELLTEDPIIIKQKLAEIVRKQREAGEWK